MKITIIGLGPGDASLLTRQAWNLLAASPQVYLRTGQHPTISGFPAGLEIHTFDFLYEEAGDFVHVYEHITQRVFDLGQRPEGVVYAVPGHPLMGEATVTALMARAAAENVPLEVVAGISFVEPVLTALAVDGMSGLQVIDALDVAMRLHPPINPDAPALLGQIYNQSLASDVKLTLMNQYPDEHPVQLVHGAGSSQEQVESVPLYAIDHSSHIAHLTALYVPPLPRVSSLASFQETIARLRAPDGCPWDQEQTHQSLARGLMEEAAEVADALAAGEVEELAEELGDLLLHVVMQAQIGAEDGEFTMSDVIAGIEAKIRRRHPHVFGDVQVSGVEQVFENWDAIKREERGQTDRPPSALDNIPSAFSALAHADKVSRRAAKAGFDWPSSDAVLAQVREEMDELLAAGTGDEQMAEMGDLLFTIVNWARWLDIDPDQSLRLAVHRFRQRFQALEQAAHLTAGGIANLAPQEIERLWRQAKQAENG